MTKETSLGEIKLGQTSGYWYLAFQPPLTPEQYALVETIATPNTAKPTLYSSGGSDNTDGSMEIGLSAEAFEISADQQVNERAFVDYAAAVAESLGSHALIDTTVHIIGPGPSIFEQAEGIEPQW